LSVCRHSITNICRKFYSQDICGWK
jgi:hypothetical protein